MKVYQQFNIDIVLPVSKFIKNKTPAQVFSGKFCEFLQPVTLLKTRLQQRCFPEHFVKEI